MNQQSLPHVGRAILPQVMFVEDVAAALDLPRSEAEAALRRGDCGPIINLNGRPAVLRTSFLAHLERQERDPRSDAPHEGGV